METKTMTTQTKPEVRFTVDPSYAEIRRIFREGPPSALSVAYFTLARAMLHSEDHANPVSHALEKMQRAFTPVTRPIELANGRKPYDTMESVIKSVSNTIKTSFVPDDEVLTRLRSFAKDVLAEHRLTRGT